MCLERGVKTHPTANIIDNKMIQLCLEVLLISNDAFGAVAIRVTVALTVDRCTPTAHEQKASNVECF